MVTHILYLTLIKSISAFLPIRIRFHFCKLFYNYNKVKAGVELVYSDKSLIKYLINTKDYIDWNLFFLGAYERDMIFCLECYLKPGMVVIEAGANTGSETFMMSRLVSASGRVIAFEPISHIFKKLTINHLLNPDLVNVNLVQNALGEKKDVISFFLASKNDPNQGMASKYSFFEGIHEEQVNQITLDDYIDSVNLQRVDLIKMDVQGAEFDILKGATKSIIKFRPIIILEAEIVANAKYSLDDLYGYLLDLGYQVFEIGNGSFNKPIDRSSLPVGNWLAVNSLAKS
jgi:FkbM family methyltransferase